MNLQPMGPGPACTVFCVRCNATVKSSDVLCDLDALAGTYYCGHCACCVQIDTARYAVWNSRTRERVGWHFTREEAEAHADEASAPPLADFHHVTDEPRMRDGNNARNRWRRMRDAHEAYGWAGRPFRSCWRYFADTPDSYAADPASPNFNVTLRGPNK